MDTNFSVLCSLWQYSCSWLQQPTVENRVDFFLCYLHACLDDGMMLYWIQALWGCSFHTYSPEGSLSDAYMQVPGVHTGCTPRYSVQGSNKHMAIHLPAIQIFWRQPQEYAAHLVTISNDSRKGPKTALHSTHWSQEWPLQSLMVNKFQLGQSNLSSV